ncbi:hypothetical protein D3C80_2116500 [compost metagenome]
MFINPLRPVARNNEVRQLPDLFRLFAVIEMFEMAKADMAFRHPQQHCPALRLFTEDRMFAGDYRQGPRRRDPQMV